MNGFNLIEFGKRIRKAREKLNMSQFQLYEETGISTTQISAYENGKKTIGLQSLAKIAAALKTSMDELYYGSANLKPINTSTNAGELIVNCVSALYEKKVIMAIPHGFNNEYVADGVGHYYRIGFSNYVRILDDLVTKLDDFEDGKKNYPDPDGFKAQLLASAKNQINACEKENKKK